MVESLHYEDALSVVEYLDNVTTAETDIRLKTDLTSLIFEIHTGEGVYEVSIDLYEEPANNRFTLYDHTVGKEVYTVGV